MKNILYLLTLLVTLTAFSQIQCDSGEVQAWQERMNSNFQDQSKSPLPAEDLSKFRSLDFFPYAAQFCVVATFIRTPNEAPFKMKTTTDRLPVYTKYGEAHFVIKGSTYKLNLYQSADMLKFDEYKNRLFLPYSDLTSGKETYIGGRYIDIEIPSGNTMIIHFNRSYNPYCAYNYKYSCPVVPLENDLPVAIKAGVKKYHD